MGNTVPGGCKPNIFSPEHDFRAQAIVHCQTSPASNFQIFFSENEIHPKGTINRARLKTNMITNMYANPCGPIFLEQYMNYNACHYQGSLLRPWPQKMAVFRGQGWHLDPPFTCADKDLCRYEATQPAHGQKFIYFIIHRNILPLTPSYCSWKNN